MRVLAYVHGYIPHLPAGSETMLHEMLRTYRWEIEPGYTLRWDNTSLPVPVGGIPMRLHRL